MISSIIFTLILFASFIYFGIQMRMLADHLSVGKPEIRTDRLRERIGRVLKIAFGQSKLLREPFAGLVHAAIFWGFMVLIIAVVEAIGEGVTGKFSFAFLGIFYKLITFSQEIFCTMIVIAVIVSLGRRFVTKVKRLQVEIHGRLDAAMILVWISVIVSTLVFQNAARIGLTNYAAGWHYPVSSVISSIFTGNSFTHIWEQIFWWAHIVLVLVFLNYLPKSKHLHIITSIPNVFFSSLKPKGMLLPVNLNDEKAVKFGAADIDDLTWKQLLDGMTCTECGRCDSVCPANTTGKVLSPRKIMKDTRRRTSEKAPELLAVRSGAAGDGGVMARTLLDNYITEKELWSCTTCMACVQECPVMIEHVDEIVELRRGLVLNESRFPAEVRTVFDNLERNFTPWAFSHSSRADWTAGLDVPLIADKKNAEYLFWVGCAGAYDARYQKVTKAFVHLMKLAGVDFAILGTEEKCNGDAARRMGNEYLAQMLMAENVETLNRYGVKNIITTCPHCFHAMKKEYPSFGGQYQVTHHTDFLAALIRDGKLQITEGVKQSVVFHDSCYLARYNDIQSSPRQILSAIPGLEKKEMDRNGDRTFCCGAGGGRMFMEETEGKRINEVRTAEALSTGAQSIGTACPFCMTMMEDGVKAHGKTENTDVKDIAEILWEAVGK